MKIQIAALVITMAACAPKHSQVGTASTGDSDSVTTTGVKVEAPRHKNKGYLVPFTFDYAGVAHDATHDAMAGFDPLANVLTLASKSINVQDSVEYLHEGQPLNSGDSAIFMPAVRKAYQALISYKEWIEAGNLTISSSLPLLRLTRIAGPADSSCRVLPKVSASKFFTGKKFFFVGGAPFVTQNAPPEGNPFVDYLGKPERHYLVNVTENSSFLLRSIYYFKKPKTAVAFGPPVLVYEMGPQEVDGIGSVIHNFPNRVPVFLLTEKGVVPAELLSVTVLLHEVYDCVSSLPEMELACHQLIDAENILGIYIPLETTTNLSCTVVHSNRLWTADLDGDGIPDVACVSNTFAGAASDTMAEEMWFVNVNGEWKIIDYGIQPDCT